MSYETMTMMEWHEHCIAMIEWNAQNNGNKNSSHVKSEPTELETHFVAVAVGRSFDANKWKIDQRTKNINIKCLSLSKTREKIDMVPIVEIPFIVDCLLTTHATYHPENSHHILRT